MYNTERTSRVKRGVLTALMVACLIAIIGGTYARYISSASGTGTIQVAKWAVKINDANIVSTDTFTVTFSGDNGQYVRDGRIAPASSLYADFIIDPTGSEVAIDYEFVLGTITASSGSVPEDLAIEKVVPVTGATISGTTVTGGTEGTALEASGGKYTGTINLASQTAALTSSEAVVVRVYVKWTNNEAHNSGDTTIGDIAPTLTMTITGTAKQHIAE